MSTVNPLNSFGSATGVLFLETGGTPSVVAVPSAAPNSMLVSNSTGSPVFATPPTTIIINNATLSSAKGVCYPTAGSAPIASFATITNTLAYTSSAASGFATTLYTPLQPTISTLQISMSFPIWAQAQDLAHNCWATC